MEFKSLLASLKANTACKEPQRQGQPPWTVHSTFLDFPRWLGFYPAILRMHSVFLAKNWQKTSLKQDWLQGPSGARSNRGDQAPWLLASHFQLNCTQHSGEEWKKDTAFHGILQSRTLDWVAMPSSRGSSWPRNRTCISYVSWIERQVVYQ